MGETAPNRTRSSRPCREVTYRAFADYDEELRGLCAAEVEERIRRGAANTVRESTSRTYGAITRANVFTLFNGIISALLFLILIFGSFPDALFGIVLVVNAMIGIVQEIRAKRVLDRLALQNAPNVNAIREGRSRELAVHEIVVDDLIKLRSGDQIVVDGPVVAAEGLEVDESLLSGESLPIPKQKGDGVYSGSFVTAGTGVFKVAKVGPHTYVRQLSKEARQFAPARSELMAGINRFLRYVVWAMIAVAPFLFFTQRTALGSAHAAISFVVAGLVGMVPQGLVLLTSIAFAVSVIALGRQRVLVQELPAVEGLARVDVMCFDKTGTLTEKELRFARWEKLDQSKNTAMEDVLRAFGEIASPNPVLKALAVAFPRQGASPAGTMLVPFSSERKWSAIGMGKERAWILGAPDVLSKDLPAQKSEFRVLLLSSAKAPVTPRELPQNLHPVAFLFFEERIREDASATLKYFERQNISVKVISGDSPQTVAAVCSRAGLAGARKAIDGRTLPRDLGALGETMENHTVFGRVLPGQKRDMIRALQAGGHVVAMVGDGVNDVLALKSADLGIAMGSGAPATRAVARLVLLDDNFSALPLVAAEGRRVMANIERVANLFLTKTAYITILAVTVGALLWPFPFLPRHLTLIDGLTIGIPAFFLSLAPNARRYRSGFIGRVLRFVIPAGAIAAMAALITYGVVRAGSGANAGQATTASFLALILCGLWILVMLSRPLTAWRKILPAAMAGLLVAAMLLPWTQNFFALTLPGAINLWKTMGIAIISLASLEVLLRKRLAPDGNLLYS